jgi:hypothetical protein
MCRSIVLEWLQIADWLAVDDRPAVNSDNPDSESAVNPISRHRTRRAPRTNPSKFSVSAFRLAGRGVF